MSEINSSNQSLNNILDKLGINSSKEKFAPRETKDQLGQDDFLKLIIDPLFNFFWTYVINAKGKKLYWQLLFLQMQK